MAQLRSTAVLADGRRVVATSTTRAEGSFSIHEPPAVLAERRAAIHRAEWTWLRQVHGSDIVTPTRAGDQAGASADGLIITEADAPGCVQTADCVPVVLVGTSAVAVVHAGWQGWAAGVVDEAGAQLDQTVTAVWFGPHIAVGDYEFGVELLQELSERFGPEILGCTTTGRPGLDLFGLMTNVARRHGWPSPTPIGGVRRNTADDDLFSHRVRGDTGRSTTVVWLEDQ